MEQPLPLTPKQALAIIGGLSKPSKMPGYGYGISAFACKTGSKLREIENSVCSGCYALKGFYRYPNVETALLKRVEYIDNTRWVEAMVVAIKHYEKSGYYRIHDSGDIQSVKHLADICEIARQCPDIKFWMPSREYQFISEYINRGGIVPKNLNIRLSAHIIDGPAPSALAKRLKLTTSTVTRDANKVTCPSNTQGNKCLDCRKCWSKDISNITYHKH